MASVSCSRVKKVDPVGGREIIELEDGKTYILKSAAHSSPQLEISISADSYGIAELSSDGTGVSPYTIELKSGKRELSRSYIENGSEVIVMDENGDGIADQRMIIDRSATSPTRPKIEDISVSYSPKQKTIQSK